MNIGSKVATSEVGGTQAISRAVLLLRHVGVLGEASLSELVTLTALSKPTVRRMLLALMEAGLIGQDNHSKHYHLGVETYALGQMSNERWGIHQLSIDSLRHLAQISHDTTFLNVRQGFATLCLHREEGGHPIRTHVLKPGDRLPLAAGSAGLAILSALSDAEIDIALAANRQTIGQSYASADIDGIHERIARTRRTGWALNPGLVFAGSWGIAAAIRNPRGEPVAALTVATVESRLQPEREAELGPLLLAEVKLLESALSKREHAGRSQVSASAQTTPAPGSTRKAPAKRKKKNSSL